MQARLRFGFVLQLGASLLEEVSYETLAWETTRFTFWRKSRTKRVIGLLYSVWADPVAPWWKMRLRGAVPLGSVQHAGVNAGASLVSGMTGGIV